MTSQPHAPWRARRHMVDAAARLQRHVPGAHQRVARTEGEARVAGPVAEPAPDGVHPSPLGHRLIGDAWFAAVDAGVSMG
ncbi:hypothetical protein OG698_09455 [Streptomyces sp. NBC_01003]|uniref:hypothetical protein n=1 Tax=Streptomyces sp. NBC_01003 TaxID=2903714 RepID=UPI003867C196|nr:hypothetical protein OG698_09455 [Streptomyces sp. NBC_01003]